MAAQAVEFSVSGHINRAIVSVDGGGKEGMKDTNDGDFAHKDANASQTRFRFTGSEEIESGMTAGVNLEYGGIGPINARHANVYLTTSGGKISVGHTSAATDGMAHADLGGLAWLGGASNWCSFYGSAPAGATYAAGGPACESNDGGRQGVLRYDTPAIGPASIAVSAGNDDYWDLMLKIAGSFGDAGYDLRVGHIGEYDTDVAMVAETNQTVTGKQFIGALKKDGFTISDAGVITAGPGGQDAVLDSRLAQAIAAHNKLNKVTVLGVDDTPDLTAGTLYNKNVAGKAAATKDAGDVTTASAAVSFGQGTSIALSWSQDDVRNTDYHYAKLDHNYGAGSVSAYYKQGERDMVSPSTLKWNGLTGDAAGYDVVKGKNMTHEGSVWGLAIGHDLGSGAAAYAGYRRIQEDGMNDTDLLVAGMRVTFN
jgi:hypothetical protein